MSRQTLATSKATNWHHVSTMLQSTHQQGQEKHQTGSSMDSVVMIEEWCNAILKGIVGSLNFGIAMALELPSKQPTDPGDHQSAQNI